MENMMKRAISAFMALVLVLGMMPGVPMFAGAEEVETQPETVAVETTEAVTVPEETEAPETTAAAQTEEPETVPETAAAEETVPATTEPEETVPETTVAEETVPETTAAQETVPEETVPQETEGEETVPEETVAEETVPEETIPEVTEEAAGASDTVVVAQKIEISASKESTYAGDDVQLTATFTPAETTDQEVVWVVEEGSDIVNQEILAEHGYLRTTGAGTVKVHAQAKNNEELVSEAITVTFVNHKMEINELAIEDEFRLEGEEFYVLKSGASMPISVKYMYWDADQTEEDAKAERPLHTPELVWSLEEGSEKYAELVVNSANPKEVTLKAKLVTEYQFVTVKVVDNKFGWSDTITIRLYPNSYKLYITDENGKDVTNGTILLDMADPDTKVTQNLKATIWPIEGDEDLVWSVSNTLVELEDLDEDLTANKSMDFTADPRTGDSVITIKGVANKDLHATVTIKRTRLIQNIDLSVDSAKVTELMVGKSVTLKAIGTYESVDESEGETVDQSGWEVVDNKLLKWELAEGDEAYATISNKGVLKAKSVSEGRVVTVRCSVIGREDKEGASFEHLVIIRPKATAVKILAGAFGEDNSPRMASEQEVLNGKTITVDSASYEPCALDFIVENYVEEPTSAGDPVGAKQEVTWKSSNTSVAYIDPLTDEIVWKGKNGTTTITATATDGSKKSASVKITFGVKLQDLYFNDEEGMFLRSGTSWTFDLGFYPENASNKAVTWAVYALDEDGEFTANASSVATISSKGKLSAKTVYDNHLVQVVATSSENPELKAYFGVLIRPKRDYALTILDDEDKCVTKGTIMLDVGTDVQLSAMLVGESLGAYEDAGAGWKTSNAKVATVEDGYVYAEKTGSATITAIGQDGQKATVTIKVVSKVDAVEVYEKNDIHVLASGKSLSLKTILYDEETVSSKYPNGKPSVTKVTWHIEEGGEQYATVNSSGKVTAVKGYTGEPKTIYVYAAATDGGGAKSDPYAIEISPIVEGIRIDMVGQAQTTGSYTHFMLEPGEEYVLLNAVTYPTFACDEVNWTTSNKSIATVEQVSEVNDEGDEVSYGKVTFLKAGNVTITATARDGSGKKATFKIKVVRKAAWLQVDNWKNVVYDETVGDYVIAIAGGKSVTLKPVLYDTDEKKVSVTVGWEIDKVKDEYGTAFVTSFKKGAIKTAKVTEPKYTTVTIKVPVDYVGWSYDEEALDQDGYVHCTVPVVVYPATTSLQITDDEDKVITSMLWREIYCEDIVLGVETNKGAAGSWEWTSSNPKIAVVDEDGVVSYINEEGKGGWVTITAKAKDGTGKKDSIKIYFAK